METNMLLLILLPLATAFVIPLIDVINLKIRRVLVLLSGSAALFISLKILFDNLNSIRDDSFFIQYYLGGWSPPFGINLVMDNLSLFFSLLVSLGLFLIIIYSIGFIGHHEGKYYVLLFLIAASSQGIILTGDLFNLYVFIELLTVASAPLVGFKRNRVGTEAAIKYLFYGIIGGVFFLIGVILVYFNLGTLNMAEAAAGFAEINNSMQVTIIIIFLLSLLIKLGIFPFHYWLPKAHSSCPSSVSALLSGIMMKIYLYVFLRVFFIVIGYGELTAVDDFIVYLALISSFLGHIFALQADDIKRMLAFSTIGHIGMITAALALNTAAGLYGGLLHVISHLLMKSGLFTGAGYLLQYTRSHQIKDFTGVGYQSRGVFISFIANALGMIGIPPLIGFISKWYILLAFLKAGNHTGVILVIFGSLTAVIYYLRYISHGLEKIEDREREKDGEPALLAESILALFHREEVVKSVIYIFTIGVFAAGIFFRLFDLPLNAAVEELLHREYYIRLILGG